MKDSDLKILHLDTGREWRGGQAQVFNLCQGLARAGIRQALACPAHSPLAKRAQEAGLRVLPFEDRGEWNPLAVWRLRGILNAECATHIHAHDAHAHALGWIAKRRASATRLVVSRRVDFPISRNPFSHYKYLDPTVRFIAISNGVRDVLVRGGVAAERIHVVPSGVDPTRFSYNAEPNKMRAEFGIPAGAPIIGNIGSLVDHKGHRYLLEAVALVRQRFPEARFILVGDGDLRGELELQASKLGIADAVHFAGFRADIETFLAGFDVFALSSHLEGLCTSLIDAMLLHVPVVATDTGGVPDLVRDGETGLLVPPRNPGALADAIIRSLQNRSEAQRLAKNAERHARTHFTAEAMVAGTIEAYRTFAPACLT